VSHDPSEIILMLQETFFLLLSILKTSVLRDILYKEAMVLFFRVKVFCNIINVFTVISMNPC